MPSTAWGQNPTSSYSSAIDQEMTIRKVTLLPVRDNLDGIYAKPIQNMLEETLRKNHQFDFVESQISTEIGTLSDLEENPPLVKQITSGVEADLLLGASIVKGPTGISLRLNAFLIKDGTLFLQESAKDLARFEISEIKNKMAELYQTIIQRIPYEGLILSRQGNRVTINMGRKNGAAKDQVVTIVQIVQVTRHPKFNFLIRAEKEILGKVKILKVEETLSFGAVLSERDKGVITRFSKVDRTEMVTYPEPQDLSSPMGAGLQDRPDSQISFGNNPQEWVPMKPPSFGQVSALLGLGQYAGSMNAGSAGTLEGKSQLYPNISLNGELWLNPSWTVRAEIQQAVLSTPNPRAGSSPSTLNHSMSRYALLFGYNFLLRDDFFGPKLQVRTGFMTYRMFVDDSSPRAFTTVNYSGYVIGIAGSLPVTPDKVWYVGAYLNAVLFSKLNESPVTSAASSSNTINEFGLSGEKKIGENLRAVGSIDFSLYSSSMSGAGTRPASESATSLSQRHTSLSAGILWMF